jgi:hypothetical protein
MTKSEIELINVERLDGWEKQLTEHHATPILLVGVGHDHVSGKIHICVNEDFPDQHIQTFLRKALDILTQQN